MKKTTIDIARIETMFEVAMQNDEITTMCIPNEYVSLALATYLENDYTIDILDIDNADYDDEYFVVLDNKNKTFSIEKAIKTYGLKGIQIYDIITDNFYILSGTPNYKKIANKFLNDNNIALFIKFHLDEYECDKTYDEPDTGSIITGVKEKVNYKDEIDNQGVYITIKFE